MLTNNTFQTGQTPERRNCLYPTRASSSQRPNDRRHVLLQLKGSKIIFREDSVNNPTLTISNGGSLIMTIDTDTGDLPKIYGEGNLDAVDIAPHPVELWICKVEL